MKTNFSTYLILLFSLLTLFVGFYFNEDSSGSGGFINDFNDTWGYIEALKDDLFVSPAGWTVHTPLHYILVSKLNIIVNSQFFLRLIFCTICLIIPYLFFLCLKVKFPKLKIDNLVLLSSIILVLPAFRSSLIWLNAHATALVFFLIFLYFFLKWEKKNYESKISKDIFFQIIFLALAVYARQYYAYFYAYLMFVYFLKFNFKNFLIVSIIVIVLAIPGFILIFYEPMVLKSTFDTNLSNTLLVSASIISFYLIPFHLVSKILNKKKINLLNIKKQYGILLSLLVIIIISNFFFDYNHKVGGGFFLKLSYLIFKNNFLFLISSFLGLYFLYELYKEEKKNIFLILIILFGFSAYMIFQKYFEPMFLFILILMLKSEMVEKFISEIKNIYYLYLYFLCYLIVAITNNIFKITKTLI